MSEFDGIVEDASTRYGNWEGTLAYDDPDDEGALERNLGIDPNRYWVLGLKVAHIEGAHFVDSYVVDKDVVPDTEALREFAVEHEGQIPVTRIKGTGLRFDQVLSLFKRAEFVARSQAMRALAGCQLRITGTEDLGNEFPMDD
ncbi:MAG: hypothetical protein ACRDV9_02765 [Acidimicrobiia bacterium]